MPHQKALPQNVTDAAQESGPGRTVAGMPVQGESPWKEFTYKEWYETQPWPIQMVADNAVDVALVLGTIALTRGRVPPAWVSTLLSRVGRVGGNVARATREAALRADEAQWPARAARGIVSGSRGMHAPPLEQLITPSFWKKASDAALKAVGLEHAGIGVWREAVREAISLFDRGIKLKAVEKAIDIWEAEIAEKPVDPANMSRAQSWVDKMKGPYQEAEDSIRMASWDALEGKPPGWQPGDSTVSATGPEGTLKLPAPPPAPEVPWKFEQRPKEDPVDFANRLAEAVMEHIEKNRAPSTVSQTGGPPVDVQYDPTLNRPPVPEEYKRLAPNEQQYPRVTDQRNWRSTLPKAETAEGKEHLDQYLDAREQFGMTGEHQAVVDAKGVELYRDKIDNLVRTGELKGLIEQRMTGRDPEVRWTNEAPWPKMSPEMQKAYDELHYDQWAAEAVGEPWIDEDRYVDSLAWDDLQDRGPRWREATEVLRRNLGHLGDGALTFTRRGDDRIGVSVRLGPGESDVVIPEEASVSMDPSIGRDDLGPMIEHQTERRRKEANIKSVSKDDYYEEGLDFDTHDMAPGISRFTSLADKVLSTPLYLLLPGAVGAARIIRRYSGLGSDKEAPKEPARYKPPGSAYYTGGAGPVGLPDSEEERRRQMIEKETARRRAISGR